MKNKQVLKGFLIAFACMFIFVSTAALISNHNMNLSGDYGPFSGTWTFTGTNTVESLEVGASGGTAYTKCRMGTADIANGATTEAVTLTGLDSDDLAFITQGETNGSATEFWAVCSANTLTLTCDQDPGTTITLSYITFED